MNPIRQSALCFGFLFLVTIVFAENSLPLAGEWRFALDRSTEQREAGATMPVLTPGDGVTQEWFKRDLPDRIHLPGVLQAQGYGNDISTNTPWVLALGDAWWKLQPASLREYFSQPGHVEVPFLAQPMKHYLGAAWYQRDIEIPADWKDRHFTLFLERTHWKTTVWVDDKEFPSNNSLGAPHITDLGILTPGKHRLSIRVDNRTQLPAQGHLVDSHSVSDSLGAAWNGIVGRIELQATPTVWVDEVSIFPDSKRKSIHARMTFHNLSGKNASGKVSFFIESCPGTEPLKILPSSENFNTPATNSSMEVKLDISSMAKVWDEFSPAIYKLRVNTRSEIAGQIFEDNTETTFGLREIIANDKDILINDRPVNLRLTHFGGDFPMTGYPAMDVGSWKKIFRACKDYGLNGIRFHSWCPSEAAFTAADEMGFYLQPECSLWADFGNAGTREFLEAETTRILRAYGNHPSFILLAPSNEPRNYQRVTPQWAVTNYAKDNRRLYSAGTGWADPSQVSGGAQFATLVRFGGGELRNTAGWFGRDYRRALETVHIPVLAHEVGQWCAYPDFDVIKKFTGYLRSGNYNIFKYIADQEGVLEQNHAFARASGRFQVECYKEEIEANLRTPGLAGFQILDLHDYLGQGTAFVGVLDAFWEPKSYVTAAEYHRFSGPTVPLARLANRTFTTDQTFESDVEIYHFGEKPLTKAMPYWKVVNSSGKTVAAGDWDARDIPISKNILLGKVSMDLSKLAAPAAYKLVIGLKDSSVENDWNFWLYPAQVSAATPADVLVTRTWSEATTHLASGEKVLFIPNAADLDPAKCPPMKNVPVFWNIQMTVRPPQNPRPKFDAMLGLFCDTNHPALEKFPTEGNCDWQWIQLVNNVRSVNLSSGPRSLRPIVSAIDDWNRNWRLGVIFECNVGTGKLLVSAINLNNERGGSELQQLRRSLLDYMAGEKFKPTVTLTLEQANNLWADAGRTSTTTEPGRVFDPDLNDGTIPVAPQKP